MTALYDAILSSLNHLEKGKCDKKVLVLISDGGDNNSAHGSEEVMRMVRESRATIYTIGIFDSDDPDRNPALLRRLAQVSGGEVFFPRELSEVAAVCRQIAGDIRIRYTIGYVPVRTGDLGSQRKIKVIASNAGGHRLVVHTRASYFLPERRL
jgi:Ca-activated chloride channel family protein